MSSGSPKLRGSDCHAHRDNGRLFVPDKTLSREVGNQGQIMDTFTSEDWKSIYQLKSNAKT